MQYSLYSFNDTETNRTSMDFKLESKYKPTGDQPEAIAELTKALQEGTQHITLMGVTGSGKTFTMANVIRNIQKPTLVLSHNKTLAGQLYSEFKSFFPHNAVEFFVSYYDYYQPEAYLPQTDTYIEKDLAINSDIEKLRLSAASALLSGRKDVIVVSSVSCLYGIGNPQDFHANTIELHPGDHIGRQKFMYKLTDALYSRNDIEFKRGTFRVKGDSIDVALAYTERAYRIIFDYDEIENIYEIDPVTGNRIAVCDELTVFPANNFVTTRERINNAIYEIQDDLMLRVAWFNAHGKTMEAKRLQSRVEYDIEMIKEVGYCSGIENYSRYFDGRSAGSRPFCLLDYFPKDFLLIIDESHVTVPQIRGMYGGDFSRKTNLVDYGFRLPSALDNRPLKFEEFERLTGQTVYVSATPADYELNKSEGVVVEQVIRPTGLLDPEIEVRKTENQIDRVVEDIHQATEQDDRVMITTLTKRMAEELTKYLERVGIRCRYIHSDIDTVERLELLDEFRDGLFDVLVGVNLLREGLDLPQVALVIIMDADKEGFLRSSRSLIQTAGRAARNIRGKVIMYADTITNSMQEMINATENRRKKQQRYNEEHGITPRQIAGSTNKALFASNQPKKGLKEENTNYDISYTPLGMVAEKQAEYGTFTPDTLRERIEEAKNKMEEAAKQLDFLTAAAQRDKMYELQALLAKLEKK